MLDARYGQQGKGFFHARGTPKVRDIPFIEALLPPEEIIREVAPVTVPVMPKKLKIVIKQPKKKLPKQHVKSKEEKVDSKPRLAPPSEPEQVKVKEIVVSKPQERKPSFLKQRMGFSFLSHLPKPCSSIEEILNKTRPITSEAVLK